ncbi:hypothetical protein JYU34_003903 [Plutella xylostella]|uniref:Obscurin n=1 Tax=Plutella xylostella TaxID=51655 RepID=A0ABQ7R157_PLUXY|nr:hypothetical protein JYU34_003903 [Plutella xylostella]
MQQVVTRYMKPMDKAKTPKTVFDNRELLFNNFRQIAEFHTTVLLEGIKYYAGEPRMLGRALLRMEREFDKHVAYCRDEPAAQRLLATDPHVNKYFQDLADDLGDDKGIAEHLKLPIQRINDYQLLLKELVKYSKRLNEDCTDLQKALELFLGVPNRATDNKFIASIEGYRGNIYKLGRLLTHDWFTILDSEGKAKERYLFLFKARILVCKVKRVSDDRSVFVLKDIIKLPEVEVKDHPEGNKFELHIPELTGPLVLTARKETVKTTWLEEIRQHSSDVVALAEHAADDLQLEEPEPEPEEKRKKREHEEDSAENKRVKVDVEEVLTREESLQQLKAKRKASIEKAEVAKKISKTELSEISAIHEVQEISSTVVTSEVTNKTSSDIEIKSSVTEVTTLESTQIEGQSRRQSDSTVDSVETVKIRESKVDQSALEENKFEQSSVEESKLERQYSVEEKKLEQSTAEENKVEQSSVEESKVELSSIEAIKVEQSSVEASKVEQSSIEASRITQSSLEKTKLSTEEQVSSLSTSQEQKSQESVRRKSEQGAEHISDQVEQQRRKSDLSLEQKSEQQFQQSSELISQQSIQQKSAKQSEQSFEQISQQSIQQKSEEIVQQVSTTEQKSEQLIQQTSEQTLQQASTKQQLSEQSVLQSSEQKSEHSVEQTSGSVRQETISEQKVSSEKTTVQSTVEQKTTRVIEETSSVTSSSVEKSSVQESVIASVTESQASKVESGQAREEAKEVEQIVTEGENGGDEMSRYNRSSRLSGDYSSARSGSRYESSSYESTGLSSTYSRRESGSRRESSKYESESSLEGTASSRYESSSKYESASAKLANGSSKYGIESSYSTNGGQIEGSANSFESYSSSKALANGSITTGESAAIRSKTESADGKPHFSVTLEGQNIELTAEERRQKNALNMPYFLVALTDTEILENTYLRFMVKVKGDPNPDVTFFHDGKEIRASSAEKIDIIRTLADRGCYELVIADVTPAHAGTYSCKAINIYGDVTCDAKVTVVDDKNIFGELPPGGEGLLARGEKPAFTWKRDGEPFDPEERFKVLLGDDEDSLALVFQHVKPEDAGLYTCVAKTSTGNISCSAELTVQGAVNHLYREPEKPTLVIEHREAIASAGGSAMLELQCKGFPKPELQFKHDGKVIEADARHKFLYEDEESMSLVIKNVTSADAGVYEVLATNELGTDNTEIKLVVKAAPKIKQKIENQTCLMGESHTVTIEIEGTPTPEVSFFKDGVEIKASDRILIVKESEEVYKITIKDAKLTDTGSYSVVAKNEINQSSDFWQWQVVTPPKVLKKMGKEKIVEESETVTLEIKTEAEPAPEVKWFKNKVELVESSSVKFVSEGQAHSLVITSASRADAGEYSCEIRNTHGSVTDSSHVRVRAGPIFTERMTNKSAKEGDKNIEFTVSVEAYPEPTIKWYQGDVEITEKKSVFTRVDKGSSHKLILKEISAELSGTYKCKVTNELGEDSCEATFTVNRKPRITKSLVDMTVNAGQTLTLDVEVEGCPDPKVKWFKDGKEVNVDARIKIERDTQRLENYHLTVNLVKEEDGGEYEVRAENEMGSVSCKSTVTVHTPPSVKESNFKDKHVYESLPLVYTVEATGFPAPTVRWLHEGKEVKNGKRIKVTNEGDIFKLEIPSLEMEDGGKWQCEIINDVGKKVLKADLSVDSVNEFRKPIFTSPLEAQRALQREPATFRAVCTADPLPHVSWLLNGELLMPSASTKTTEESKETEHGLKECTYTLHIPSGHHTDTGEYTIQAKNQYGVGESSARLDIMLKPEIEGLADINAQPFEERSFVAVIHANPIAEVKWIKDGVQVLPSSSSNLEIVEDRLTETFKLTVKKVEIADGGVYTLTAKNELGETSKNATLSILTGEPVFTKPLQKQAVKDFDTCTLKVRADGVPKPDISWYREGELVTDDERHQVTTEVAGQVDSQLEIKEFCAGDAGKYMVRATNLVSEAVCEAIISLDQSTPGFTHKLERQKDVDEGEPILLTAKLQGSPRPTATWFKDGIEIPKTDPRITQVHLPDGTVKLSIEHAVPTDCGAYKLQISNPNGDYTALCAVAVNPTPRKPSFSQDLEDQKTTVGQPLKLQATIMAYPAPEVKWFKDGVPIRPSQAVNFINQPGGLIGLSIDACRPEDAGVYSLTVANKLGEVQSKATVEVSQREKKPAFIAELQPATVIEGFPARLEVKVLGHPPPTIKWTHNGKEIVPDGTHLQVISKPDGSQALLIDKATAADAGEYAVVAVNDKGEVASKAQLSVAGRTDDSVPQERPQLIHGLRDMTAEEGQPLALGAAYVGNPVPDVTWTKDGVPLVQADDVSIVCHGNRVGLEISPCAMSHAGVYSVKLVNPLGEDESSATVAVRKVYQPPSFSQKFTDLQQLPTFDAKFPARVQGVPAPDITWLKDGQPVREGEKYHIKRDGDAVCLYVRDVKPEDSGKYSCVARNREGEDSCAAQLEVVDTIRKRQKMEPPYFLKKIGDTEVYRGMSAKFTACAAGSPEPDVEWYRNGDRMFPCERIRMDKESTGLLRLTISQVEPTDVGTYTCRIYNDHGHAQCSSELTYDTLEPRENRKPIGDQYSDFDKMKKTGVPMPLADRPIIARMTDRHLTLGWKPSVPHGPRFPVTYQVEMCELPDGDWFTARTGLRSCVCDIRNLEPFRDYKFRIRVENKFGVSDPSPYATTHRSKLQPPAPRFVPYLPPGTDFRPDSSARFPQDFDIERPLHDGYSQAPGFLRQVDPQYGVKGHNVSLYWFVYGYPKPKMEYYFNDEKIEIGGRYDWSYTRNGQATLFINKMLERDIGFYEAVAINEHGQARQRVPLEIAEYPVFIKRPEETVVLERKNARIEARVTGVPYPDIKWYKDWQPLAESSRIKIKFIQPDTTILVINDAILKDEGLYSISASNVAGAVSSSAMLHIEESVEEYSYRIREHPPRIKASTKPFGDYYDLGDELGRGVQGVVYHAAERLSGRNYAAKIMHGHSELKPFMKNELEIMNMLNDRHLIRLHDAYEHDHTLALVMELAGGGELVRDKLLRSSLCTEREIAGYMRQLLRGLKYMHDNNVAHLGLTIGELLISHAGSDELKICDFGLSRRIQFGKHATLDYGVPEYVAPEVAAGEGVSYSADLWSVGIITYILLGGHSPFRGANDRETLSRIRQGRWDWHDEEWWSRFSVESRDFISKLLCYNVHERMDVNAALNHPWLTLADKIYEDEYQFTLDRLRNYYSLYREWMSNAQCRTWFRRRPLSGAFEHPSKMVYPPGEIYTPEGSPERDTHDRKGSPFDLKFKQWEHPDWEVSAKSESHYQNGPDTYLLQLRDTDFPVRLREYMKVACTRSVGYSLAVHDTYDPRTPIIRERRRFTDIMDEEIDDERRDRINNYGTESYTIRRLRHELGTRLDSYAEAQAFMESKKDGQLPFLREKPQLLPIREGEPAQLSCFAVGDPKPSVQWFKNDMVIAEGNRIKIIEDEEGRSTLRFEPAMHHDIGYYKVVARNKVGQTVARTRVVEACTPDAPDSPTAAETSDTEVLLRWKQPKYDGNSPVVCYGLQYKEGDSIEWKDVAHNIDHEFFVLRDLKPDTSYQFRLSSRNRIGWSDQGIPTHLVKTKAAGAPKLEITKAMKHLQQITESGQDIVLDEERPKLNYNTEESPIEWDSSENFTDKYSFISELWRGKFSIAVKGVDKSNNNVVVAKILENRPETEVMVKREYECIRRLRHERISNLIAAYQAPAAPIAALILEKLQGADILTYLSSRHDYTEQMVATIVTQILDGLQYIHWRGYCHLDLQPDNVVMSSVRTIQVKIIDFGSAHKVTKLGTSVPSVGELEYKAPEIINDEPAYPQTDIWSLGVLTYIMLSGVSPFRGEDDSETKQNISFVRYRFEHLYKEISQEATRFLMFLFKKVPLKRPSAEECHEHRWLTQSDFMNKKRERSVFLGNRLKEFSDEYHSRKSAEASQADTVGAAFGQVSPRQLIRSNSIQEELFTNFSSA